MGWDCEAYGLKKHGLTRSDCILNIFTVQFLTDIVAVYFGFTKPGKVVMLSPCWHECLGTWIFMVLKVSYHDGHRGIYHFPVRASPHIMS